jgi:arabinogalactan endo-1,4-beta-galactosidase
MAGTDHMVYDMMDEEGLSLFYANILIKLILKRNDIPDIDDASYFPFLDELAKQNIEYDILSNKMVPFINVNALRRKYIYEKMIIEIKKNYVMILSILVVLFILLLPLCI